MARITVEDCLENVENRFELVMLASRRARSLRRFGNDPLVPEAADLYKKAISLNPDQLYVWLNYAAYYLHKENNNEAKKCLNEVLRIDPYHFQAKELLNKIK